MLVFCLAVILIGCNTEQKPYDNKYVLNLPTDIVLDKTVSAFFDNYFNDNYLSDAHYYSLHIISEKDSTFFLLRQFHLYRDYDNLKPIGIIQNKDKIIFLMNNFTSSLQQNRKDIALTIYNKLSKNIIVETNNNFKEKTWMLVFSNLYGTEGDFRIIKNITEIERKLYFPFQFKKDDEVKEE